jgi:hypothetical protein
MKFEENRETKYTEKKLQSFVIFFHISGIFFRAKLKLCLYTKDAVVFANHPIMSFFFVMASFRWLEWHRHGLFITTSRGQNEVMVYPHNTFLTEKWLKYLLIVVKTRKIQLLCVFPWVEEEPTLVGFIFSLVPGDPFRFLYQR